MKKDEPKIRFPAKKAIEALIAQYGYPYEDGMQDWPYEIVESTRIQIYFQHYDEQTDEDRKFILMEMIAQALTEIQNENDFLKNWNLLEKRIKQNFKNHEYTVFYWSCFGENISDCWKISPYMRKLWKEIKND